MRSVVGFPHVAVVEGGVLLGFTVLLWLKEECCWVSPRAVVEGGVDVHPDVWSNNMPLWRSIILPMLPYIVPHH